MKTLDQKYPDAHRALIAGGYANLANMMTRFTACNQMDNALNLNGATNNWMNMKNLPNSTIEIRARDYVKNNPVPPSDTHVEDREPELELAPPAKAEGRTFLVACEGSAADKIEKVLGLLGAEVVEI